MPGLYLLVAIAMTWPVVVSLGQATGLRGDYFNNLWNFWWLRHALTELSFPWFTDYLYFPEGLSLKRHTLSPLNSIAGALLGFVFTPHTTFNLLLIGKFALAAWTFFLFARYVTGSTAGAVLGGFLYSFNPFHYYYLCQINVFTLEFVPLALLAFLKVYREGGGRNIVLAALASAGLAATAEYYVVYAFVTAGLLLLLGRWVDPKVSWGAGAKRLVVALLISSGSVALAALPLLMGTLGPEAATAEETGLQAHRTNDLLGYAWVGGPEEAIVSWPTMLGYSPLLLCLLSIRRLWKHRAWLVVGLFFWVCSLGETLQVNGADTELAMPYAFLKELPVLSMLRKADRSFMMVQLVVALLAAEAWIGLSQRLRSVRVRRIAWALCALLFLVELTPAPLQRFDYEAPAYAKELAADPDVVEILELPAMDIDTANSRYNFFQITHEKKQPLGYCTRLALSQENLDRMTTVVNLYVLLFAQNEPQHLARWARASGIDRVVHHKTMPNARGVKTSINTVDTTIDERTLWAPFFFVRKSLVRVRQTGKFVDEPIGEPTMLGFRRLLTQVLGAPIHEDEELMVFRVPQD